MRIFFCARFDLMKMDIKFVNDIGDWIVVEGVHCPDLVPYHGVRLDDGEQEKLIKWLSEHK